MSAGQAQIVNNGKITDISQQSSKAVIDWRGFNIAPDETTAFHQPSASSLTLNRVNSGGASTIDGKLTANGNIVIINQNGVLFGNNAKVDVNGIIATTANIDNNKFMNNSGKLVFDKAGNPNASIINNGTITAKDAGLVGMVAPRVINNGLIVARLGKVTLASGDTTTVDLYGDNLMEIAVSDKVKSQLVENTGTIKANGGKIVLTAADARGMVDIAKAQLTVTADGGKTMVYGSSPLPTLTSTITGFVNSEDATTAGITGAPTLSTLATAYNGAAHSGSNAGSYDSPLNFHKPLININILTVKPVYV